MSAACSDRDTRARAMEKIRKLLAMANDGRGNEHEAANAASQAEKMMCAYQIDAADVIMKELEQADAFDRGMENVYFGPRDPRYQPTASASWVGIIGIGCGAAFTCKVDQAVTAEGLQMRFSGFAIDVQLCRQVFQVLCSTVYRLSVQNYKGQGAAASKAFRSGAAGVLQRRLYEMRNARNRENAGSGGTALVLYDRKAQRVAEMFGAQKTSPTKASIRDQVAYQHGKAEGAKISISAARPLGQAPAAKQLGRGQ